jgi:hypothetical protein
MAGITFNPQLTTSPYGTFDVSTQGYYAGDFVDDPSTYMQLASGQIAASVTQPVWGGMAITESVSSVGEGNLGTTLTLASAAGNVTGFTVFTKNSAAIVTPGNNVPQLQAGMTANFFRYGSGARLKVAVLASQVAAIEGAGVNQTLYWDPALQQLTASGTAGAFQLPATTKIISVNANSKSVNYNSGTGALTWVAGAVAVIQI